MEIVAVQSLTASTPVDALIIPILSTSVERIKEVLGSYQVALTGSLEKDLDAPQKGYLGIYAANDMAAMVYVLKIDADAGPTIWKKQMTKVMFKHTKSDHDRIGLDLSVLQSAMDDQTLEVFASSSLMGMCMGYYDIRMYKNEGRNNWKPAIAYIIASETEWVGDSRILSRLPHMVSVQFEMMDLVNAPANHKTPSVIAQKAREKCEPLNIKCDVLEEKQLEELGMKALLSVNRGSPNPPVCLVLHYQGKGRAGKKVALIGKGVTFDTGGLSIKGSQNMHYMKSDMGGAAAVLGAILTAASAGIPVDLYGVIPLTENSVDAYSTKPGDVIETYHGSTIEVIDTDAEGRLILADALAYANRNFQPDHMIDLATLTGSIVRALGSHAGGLMTQDDDLAEELIEIGQKTGERLWRMPMWKEYGEMMKSDIADIKNLSAKPVAGSITAAKFLEHFTDGHSSWAHIDIAGVAFGANPISENYSATAYGVYLISEWLAELK